MGNGNLIKFHAKMNRRHILNPPSSTFCDLLFYSQLSKLWNSSHGSCILCLMLRESWRLVSLLQVLWFESWWLLWRVDYVARYCSFKIKGEKNYHVERSNYDKTSGDLNDQDLDLSSWVDSSNFPRHFFHLEPRSGRSIIWITTIITITMINIFTIVIIHIWPSMIVTTSS